MIISRCLENEFKVTVIYTKFENSYPKTVTEYIHLLDLVLKLLIKYPIHCHPK